MLVQLNDSDQEIGKGGSFDVAEDTFNDTGLRLDESEHLKWDEFIYSVFDEIHEAFTSAGLLLRNTALILAKWEAMTI